MKKAPTHSPLKVLLSLLRDYFIAIVGAAAIALFLRIFVIEAFKIPTDFMAPALIPGDRIFINKLAYGGRFWIKPRMPAPGDVVVFGFPNDPTKDYIKRVIAVAGQVIEIRSGEVFVDGRPVTASRDSVGEFEQLGERTYQVNWGGVAPENRKLSPVKVPESQFFVLGDNRAKGQDSRSWGFLHRDYIKGKAELIWFSAKEKSRIFMRVR